MDQDYRPASRGWSWTNYEDLLLPAVQIPTQSGATVWTHAFEPSRVVAVRAPDPDALRSLAGVLGAEWVQTLLAFLGPWGVCDQTQVPAPVLNPSWTRVSVVRAFRQWSATPADPCLLNLDEALAWEEAGVDRWAATYTGLCAATIATLVAGLIHGQVPPSAHADVEAAARLARRYLPPEDPNRESLERLEDEVASITAVEEDELRSALEDWVHRYASDAVAVSLGAASPPRSPGKVLTHVVVDVSVIPTRVLGWQGPEQPGMEAAVLDGSIHVTIDLADGVDPDDPGVTSLIVYTANPDTGQTLATTRPRPVHPSGGVLTAALPLPDGSMKVLVGVSSTDRLDRAPATHQAAEQAIALQHLLWAWSLTRSSLAAEGPQAARVRAQGWNAAAARAATGVADRQARTLRSHLSDLTGPNPPTPWRTMLAEILPPDLMELLPQQEGGDGDSDGFPA